MTRAISSNAARDAASIASHRARWLGGSRRSAASTRICASISSAFMWSFAKHGSHRFNRASDFRSRTRTPAARLVSDPFVQSRLIDFASSPKAARVDAAFLGEYFDDRGSPRRRKPVGSEQFCKRENAEAVDGGSRGGDLIGTPAAARHQRLVEQAGFVVDENSQPQIVVLGGAYDLVEAS